MKKIIIIWFIEWLVFDLVCYLLMFVYEDLVLSLGTALMMWIVYRRMVRKQWLKMRVLVIKKKELDYWVNALVVQSAVTPSLHETIQTLLPHAPQAIQNLVQLSEEQEVIKTLDPLIYYFNHPMYTIFHRLLELYSQQGGSLVVMTRQILMTVSQDHQDFHRYLHATHRKLRELSVGWFFTLVTLLYLKLLLPRFYSNQLTGGMFRFAIALNFILFIYSLWLYFKNYRPLNSEKGWEIE